METKRNQKYFAAKGINPVLIVGLVIALVGIVLLFGGNTRPIGIVIILVGVAVAVFGSGAKAGEYDIDNQIYGVTKEMPEQAMIKYEVYEKHFITIIKPVFLKGFDFSLEETPCKKGSDHIYRTNMFNAAQLYFTKTKIYVYGKHITLTDDSEEANYEFGGAFPYEDVKEAYIEEKKFNAAGKEISVYYFGLKLKNGEDAFKFTVEYGADVDKARDDINHVIEKMTEKAEERERIKASKRAALRAEAEKEAAKADSKKTAEKQEETAAPVNEKDAADTAPAEEASAGEEKTEE
ncbi:MAG: hypothetical protein HFE66_06455 [Clostridiales bacterium]|jgi:hypothetical protein|nr:hypothetical protein [Clostridiales bacterium]